MMWAKDSKIRPPSHSQQKMHNKESCSLDGRADNCQGKTVKSGSVTGLTTPPREVVPGTRKDKQMKTRGS